MAGPREPLCYRIIALVCISYKLFYCHTLTQWVDDNNLLAYEQNGFRKGCNTIIQISTLAIIDVREEIRKSTFYLLCFYHLKKKHMLPLIGIYYGKNLIHL